MDRHIIVGTKMGDHLRTTADNELQATVEFLAAAHGYEKFAGGSSERRWLCGILKHTDSNLWVTLHRARVARRECLEMNWFDKAAEGTV